MKLAGFLCNVFTSVATNILCTVSAFLQIDLPVCLYVGPYPLRTTPVLCEKLTPVTSQPYISMFEMEVHF